MEPKVTLILNLKMNIVTKFQVFIFKNDEVRGGGKKLPLPPPPTWNKLDRRKRGIGLMVHFYDINLIPKRI